MASLPAIQQEQDCRRTMTRCECAEITFAEIVRSARERGQSPVEVARRHGCGQTCTACLPDLEHFLCAD